MELKLIDRTDRGRNRLNTALGIYRETILPEAQNPERQILYWIEHGKDILTDEFRSFALQDGREIVGYFQYSYFREEGVFFFEYLCIQDQHRNGLMPSDALKSIADFLAQNYPPDFIIAFEIAHLRGDSAQWEPDKRLTKYFTRLGFRKVDFEYHYPILQSYQGEISYPADLMVRLPHSRTEVTASEMRTILRCIFFKHYLRWDRPFLDAERLSERERLINVLYSKEVNQLGNDDKFATSGDNKRSQIDHFSNRMPRVARLLETIFGPKLPRIAIVIVILLVAQWILGSGWLLVPFVLAVAAIYCLAEDTEASRKLLVVVMSRLKLARPR